MTRGSIPVAFHHRGSLPTRRRARCRVRHSGTDEFVADLAAQRPPLRKAQVMRVGGSARADHAGLPGDEPQVLLVAVALGLGPV